MNATATLPALPAAAPPAPRRQLLVGTALACIAGATLIGAMLAVYALKREIVVSGGERFPDNYVISEVATNVMLITVWTGCIFGQWAVYSGNRGDRAHTALALAVTAMFGVAFINGQAFTWAHMGVVLDDSAYGALFYAITGTMVVLVIAGLVFSLVAAFRSLSGRLHDSEILSAHAMYWYFVAAAYTAIWFLVYVTK